MGDGFEGLQIVLNQVGTSRQAIYLTKGPQPYSKVVIVNGNTCIVSGAYIPAYCAETNVLGQNITGNHFEADGHYAAYFYGDPVAPSDFLLNSNRLIAGPGWTAAKVCAGARGQITANNCTPNDFTIDTPGDVTLLGNIAV